MRPPAESMRIEMRTAQAFWLDCALSILRKFCYLSQLVIRIQKLCSKVIPVGWDWQKQVVPRIAWLGTAEVSEERM